MADDVKLRTQGVVFSSGNPVFDALVTIVSNHPHQMNAYESVHSKLLALAQKEPGGFKGNGAVEDAAQKPRRKRLTQSQNRTGVGPVGL
jgi:hypothetical protein